MIGCACSSDDAVECLRMRYPDETEDDPPCECASHADEPDDIYGNED